MTLRQTAEELIELTHEAYALPEVKEVSRRLGGDAGWSLFRAVMAVHIASAHHHRQDWCE